MKFYTKLLKFILLEKFYGGSMKLEPVFIAEATWLKDNSNRIVLPRGCNLGGSSKMPLNPPGDTWRSDSLNSQNVSFTGRPFSLEDAPKHFERLASWGFTFLRFCITWEAVEHAGPGIYDEEYLAYLRDLIKIAGSYGISVFIDPHQDVWSRWTGGDGAPAWTLESIGLVPKLLGKADAAITEQSLGSAMPSMVWPLNNLYYAAATMFSLFFGGNMFAPNLYVDGEPIQEYLQGHFIDAMCHTARRLKDLTNIVGFGSLNEPSLGYIGQKSLAGYGHVQGIKGVLPTPFEAMQAAMGRPVLVNRFVQGMKGLSFKGKALLNPDGINIFKEGFECPWKKAGVWDIIDETPVLRKPDYFSIHNGKPVNFAKDCLQPFQEKYIKALKKKHDQYLIFVEGVPCQTRANWKNSEYINSVVDAYHWYDSLTLMTKKWHSFITIDSDSYAVSIGKKRVKKAIVNQISRKANEIRLEGIVPFLGEFGVPFDLNNSASYKKNGKKWDFSQQEEALSSYYNGIDAALIPATIWNYTSDNTNQHGDNWNGEDLSIYSVDNGGGRAIKGFCRPYAMAIAGKPLKMSFNLKKKEFIFEWEADSSIGAPTEIFVPKIWYENGCELSYEGEDAEIEEHYIEQRIFIFQKKSGKAYLKLIPKKTD